MQETMPNTAQQAARSVERSSCKTNLNYRIVVIRQNFLEKLIARFFELEDLLNEIEAEGLLPEVIERLGHHAHKIAGVAATLGFPKLGALAAQTDASISGCSDEFNWTTTHGLVVDLISEIGDVIEDHMQDT